MSHSPQGSQWHRWDLHFHTPSSFDYENNGATNQQIVDCLIDNGIRVVAITDHHTMDVERIRELQRLGGDRLTVLPAIELRSEHGGKPVHYISIFPEHCNLKDVWTTLQGKLGLTATDITQKGGDDKVYVPMKDGAAVTRELGGIVSIHAGTKTNSINEISNREQFQQRIKYDITNDFVDLYEIGQIKDIDIHCNVIFPKTGMQLPLIVCSDNHDTRQYVTNAPLWIRADPVFRGLKMLLEEPSDRVYIGERPPQFDRVEGNRTKYIRSISFRRSSPTNPAAKWFEGEVRFNHGLVVVVGNKGTGKSALADMLGLLGASKNTDSFSFLSKGRFRHPSSGMAHCFEATLTWESGEQCTKGLDADVPAEDVERVKYLPQEHVEKVCNELAGKSDGGFERELKSVIFSHVPEPQRLAQSTLDDLVRFQTNEKQKRIDSLIKDLKEASRARALLESQADPAARKDLESKLERQRAILAAHDIQKPLELPDPAQGGAAQVADPALLVNIQEAENAKTELQEKITAAKGVLSKEERRHAVAKRLIEKCINFEKEVAVFKSSLQADAAELGIDVESIVSVSIDQSEAISFRDEAARQIQQATELLKAVEPPGLEMQMLAADSKLLELRSKLDAPQRAYRANLEAIKAWGATRTAILGTATDPECIAGLEHALSALASLPVKIGDAREEQRRIALDIHAVKLEQATVYRTLYGSVQEFINSHPLATDKLKLEFRAELTSHAFADRFLELIAGNRKGSFMGKDEGRDRAVAFIARTDWESRDSVQQLLAEVDHALHNDLRDEGATPNPVQLRAQLMKGRSPEEMYDLLYGLEYAVPRYILKWEGKDLSMLSPGERGTLLLVFYLLIDKSDVPLVIDQPEGNLDNHTVAKVLVDCIRETRKKRQVFIVTHNPNLAVVCDADQVIHASMDKLNGNSVTYECGALESPAISKFVTDVLEGTRWAFGVRDAKYRVGE